MSVFMLTSGINIQQLPMKKTSKENQIQGTSEQLELMKFQTMNFLSEDFLVRLSRLLESEVVFQTPEGHYFLKSLGFSTTKDRDIFYSKTLRVYLVTTTEKLSRQYLGFSPTWGMSLNGRYLTARISESPRIGKECSLSDILEEQIDQKYFLSEKVVNNLMKYNQRQIENKRGFRVDPKKPNQIMSALKIGGGGKDDLILNK